MKKNKITIQILAFVFVILGFIGCDEDFSSIESDVVNSGNATNFNIKNQKFDVIAYTDVLNPVQTNNTVLNTLGFYEDSYGSVTSNFLSQLRLSSVSPDFGNGVRIDSVVLTLPFFSTAESVAYNGTITYQVDSVINNNDIKLQIFESNYFLRSFNPNSEFNEAQALFSNISASSSEPISNSILEQQKLPFVDHETNGDTKAISDTNT